MFIGSIDLEPAIVTFLAGNETESTLRKLKI